MVKEILVGDNPFIGVSHLSQEKAREEAREATLENKVAILQAAVEAGGTGFTFSTHPANLKLLTYIHDNHKDFLKKLNYYILTPYAQVYVRRANVQGTPALARSLLVTITRRKTATLDLATAFIMLDPVKLAYFFIEMQITPYLQVLPKQNIKAILLHEVLTDLAAAYRLAPLLKELDKQIRRKLGIPLGLETRNLPHLHQALQQAQFTPEFTMNPINPLGYQMAPDKQTVENIITQTSHKTKYIAISILAAGATGLEQAIKYLMVLKHHIYAITTASSKAYRIRSNIRELSNLMK